MGQRWTLYQFGMVVNDFCKAADSDLWDAMEARLATLMEVGNLARMPVSERIVDSDGIFALRANADNLQGRLLYFFGPIPGQIIFVHAVDLKRQRKLSSADIRQAERNKKLALADLRGVHAFRVDYTH